jgi:hypothetical protein
MKKLTTEEIQSKLARITSQLEQINGILSRLKVDDKGRVLISDADKQLLHKIKIKY